MTSLEPTEGLVLTKPEDVVHVVPDVGHVTCVFRVKSSLRFSHSFCAVFIEASGTDAPRVVTVTSSGFWREKIPLVPPCHL